MENNETVTVAMKKATEHQSEVEKKDHTTAKVAASAVVGTVVGAGSTYAASEYLGNSENQNDNSEFVQQKKLQEVEQKAQKQVVPQSAEEQVVSEESSERQGTEDITVQNIKQEPQSFSIDSTSISENEVIQSEKPFNKQENSVHNSEPQNNRIQITDINTVHDQDGNVYHAASGTVDGHSAAFLDDGYGNVMIGAVDVNDNGHLDNGETVDLRGSGLTMDNLETYKVSNSEVPVSSVTPSSEVDVVEVTHNTEIGDVAVVSINNDTAMLVDVDRSGDADFIIHDDNSNGQIEENEVHQAIDGLHMPTSTDLDHSHMASADELPDYSDDSTITTYDI